MFSRGKSRQQLDDFVVRDGPKIGIVKSDCSEVSMSLQAYNFVCLLLHYSKTVGRSDGYCEDEFPRLAHTGGPQCRARCRAGSYTIGDGAAYLACKFFWGAVSINFEKRCNHYRLILACMLSGVSRDRPVIVGWSTAPRGQVIEESLWQLPKKLAAGPRVLARTESLRTQSGTKQGGPPHDHWAKLDKFGTLEANMPL